MVILYFVSDEYFMKPVVILFRLVHVCHTVRHVSPKYKFVAVFQPSHEKSMTYSNRLVTRDMWTAKWKYSSVCFRCISLRKLKVKFLNWKESESRFCFSLLNRSIQDLCDLGVSKEPKNSLLEFRKEMQNSFSESFRFKNSILYLKVSLPSFKRILKEVLLSMY